MGENIAKALLVNRLHWSYNLNGKILVPFEPMKGEELGNWRMKEKHGEAF